MATPFASTSSLRVKRRSVKMPSSARDTSLSDLLRAARSRITPEMVGLPRAGVRRVPGLRCEEVAELVGISEVWYRRFESGRVRVAAETLNKIADVLWLTKAERFRLFLAVRHELRQVVDDREPDPSENPEGHREIERVLGRQPSAEFRAAGALVRTWQHGELHDATSAMPSHIVMSYRGTPRRIERRNGKERQDGWTAAGCITILPAGRDDYWDIFGEIGAVHVHVTPATLQRVAASMGHDAVEVLARTASFDRVTAGIVDALAAMAGEDGDPDARLLADRLVSALCAQLVRRHGSIAKRANDGARGGRLERSVAAMTKRLFSDFSQTPTISELATAGDVAEGDVVSSFLSVSGDTPERLLRRRRIAYACELLRSRPAPALDDVARATGYRTTAAFDDAFTTAVGTDPANYLRVQQG